MTEKKYVIAEVKLHVGKEICIIEVERENKSIATLMLFLNDLFFKEDVFKVILTDIINTNGIWDKERLYYKRMQFLKVRHGISEVNQRARLLYKKFYDR